MATWKVFCTMPVFATITVDADNEDEAIEAAMQYASLTGYVGNGGTDKMVGTGDSNVSLEPGDGPIEGGGFDITAEPA